MSAGEEKAVGGNRWSAGYCVATVSEHGNEKQIHFVATVSEHGNEKQIRNYVRQQGKEYTKMYRGQIKLFD